MTFSDYLKSHFYVVKYILLYRRAFRNYLQVILHIARRKYPVTLVLRNGNHLVVKNRIEVYTAAVGLREYCNFDKNIVTVPTKGTRKQIKIYDGIRNGDIEGVFLKEEYSFLPVEGKIVIDIGTNIGDSAIYFAIRGAAKIISLEPFPENYKTARKNVDLNNLSNKGSVSF